MKKADLREEYKRKRTELPSSQRAAYMEQVSMQMPDLRWNDIHMVMSYFPMERFAEPDVTVIENYIRERNPRVHLCYPKIDKKSMWAVYDLGTATQSPNKFGTTEIENGTVVSPLDIDLIIVPLLVVDSHGYRVGYGKGYYDGFLAQCKPDAIKMGVGFFEPIDTIQDIHELDVALDYYIYPESFIIFQ